MNTTLKRILIIFSITLNIGFVITAAIMIYNHPIRPWERHLAYSENAIKHLNLTPEKEKSMLTKIIDFHQKIDDAKKDFKTSRTKILSVLAKPGPTDLAQFKSASNEIQQKHGQLHEIVRSHVLKLRQELGDKNGARYFQELIKQLESEKIMR